MTFSPAAWFFDHFTTVDAYFFWCFRRGTQFGVDVSTFQHCMAHFDRMQQRPSVQKLLAFERQTLAALRPNAAQVRAIICGGLTWPSAHRCEHVFDGIGPDAADKMDMRGHVKGLQAIGHESAI